MAYYAYIIQSLADESFYIGSCDDLDRRVSKHNEGFSKYTKGKMPWKLRYFEVFETRQSALAREKEIKRKKSRKYIQELLSGWLSA